MSQRRPEPRPLRPQDHPRLRRHRAELGAAEAAAGADRLPTSGGRARACGTAGRASCCARSITRPSSCWRAAHSSVDRARARRSGAGRFCAERLPTGRDRGARRLHRPPLSRLLAEGGPTAQASSTPSSSARPSRRARRSPAPRSRPTPSAASPSSPCSRPDHPAPAGHHRRRLRGGRRQHRRRADLHHHATAGARHHLHLARLRPRRGRAPPRRARGRSTSNER